MQTKKTEGVPSYQIPDVKSSWIDQGARESSPASALSLWSCSPYYRRRRSYEDEHAFDPESSRCPCFVDLEHRFFFLGSETTRIETCDCNTCGVSETPARRRKARGQAYRYRVRWKYLTEKQQLLARAAHREFAISAPNARTHEARPASLSSRAAAGRHGRHHHLVDRRESRP